MVPENHLGYTVTISCRNSEEETNFLSEEKLTHLQSLRLSHSKSTDALAAFPQEFSPSSNLDWNTFLFEYMLALPWRVIEPLMTMISCKSTIIVGGTTPFWLWLGTPLTWSSAKERSLWSPWSLAAAWWQHWGEQGSSPGRLSCHHSQWCQSSWGGAWQPFQRQGSLWSQQGLLEVKSPRSLLGPFFRQQFLQFSFKITLLFPQPQNIYFKLMLIFKL